MQPDQPPNDLINYHVVVDGKSFAVLRSDFRDHYQNVSFFMKLLAPELSYAGNQWLFNSFQLLVKGKVFARMAPDQKTQLVEDLQEVKFVLFYFRHIFNFK